MSDLDHKISLTHELTKIRELVDRNQLALLSGIVASKIFLIGTRMVVLAFILSILLILLVAFLVTPVSLYLDTAQGRYEVFQRPAFRFFVIIKDERIVPRLQIAGINIPLQSKREPPKNKERKKSKRKTMFRRSATAWRFLIDRSLRSFNVKQAIVDLDTDNVVLNAQLVPLFFWVSQGPVRLSTNFNGRVYLHLEVNNRPAKILWIFLQFLTKK